jgi:hypothetical protein
VLMEGDRCHQQTGFLHVWKRSSYCLYKI